eukprot:356920-Chlamydomonas_euryale.AAC.3
MGRARPHDRAAKLMLATNSPNLASNCGRAERENGTCGTVSLRSWRRGRGFELQLLLRTCRLA